MKIRLMDFLRCPLCTGKFDLVILKKENNLLGNGLENICEEIIDGLLNCECGQQYPIVRGIPIILPTAFQLNPAFYETHKSQIRDKIDIGQIKEWEKLYYQTKKVFELQWEKYGKSKKIYGRTKEEMKNHFFNEVSPKKVDPSFFKDKLCAEGGCGHGTYLQFLAELGAEVIGMDLGIGADVAYQRCKNLKKVHVIQTDIMNPPLAKNTFDYVYSLGVIHHTPNTQKTFTKLAQLVKTGGYFAVWVYPVESKLRELVSNSARKITIKLPPRLLFYLCYLPVPLLTFVRPYSGTHLGRNTWRECVECLYDWFSPEYQTHHTPEEISGWFKEEGFHSIEVLPLLTGVAGIKSD